MGVVLQFPATRILRLNGKPVDYRNPPKPTDLVTWSRKTSGGLQIKGTYRTIAWLDRINRLAIKRFGKQVTVIQSCYHTGVAASAGTHDFDACLDVWIEGVDPWIQQRFFRANGAGAYYRRPPLFSNHIHLFVLPKREGKSISDDYMVAGFKVGEYVDGGYSQYHRQITSSQLADYYAHAFGLAEQHTPGSDHSWFPQNIEATIFDLEKFTARRAKAA